MWKKILAEQPPSNDDFASISRVSITFSDETVLSHGDRHAGMSRVKGECHDYQIGVTLLTIGRIGLQKLSRAIRRYVNMRCLCLLELGLIHIHSSDRLLGKKDSCDGEEGDDVQTDFFDQDSEIDMAESPVPKHQRCKFL